MQTLLVQTLLRTLIHFSLIAVNIYLLYLLVLFLFARPWLKVDYSLIIIGLSLIGSVIVHVLYVPGFVTYVTGLIT